MLRRRDRCHRRSVVVATERNEGTGHHREMLGNDILIGGLGRNHPMTADGRRTHVQWELANVRVTSYSINASYNDE